MKVLVLGNGFDLYHKLPTRYIDFMNVIKRLKELGEGYKKCHYIRFMFGEDSPLYTENEFIQECYKVHSDVIKGTKIDIKKLDKMVELSNKNMWVAYFEKICELDIGWIDFEKEIVDVLECFKRIFDYASTIEEFIGYVEWSENNQLRLRDIELFHKFGRFQSVTKNINNSYISFDENYLTSEIEGTRIKRLDEEKIINEMYSELRDFIEILNIYIEEFIDQIAVNKISNNEIFSQADCVVSFNYTNVYEKLYVQERDVPVYHIHGRAKEQNIVLGVNANEDDELEKIDTRFIRFKKYFQRIAGETDIEYAKILKGYDDARDFEEIEVYFVGHSLDITDEDIIKELIEKSDKVTIYYHSQEVFKDYITNMVKLFGKEKVTQMRLNEKLKFEKLSEFKLKDFVDKQL